MARSGGSQTKDLFTTLSSLASNKVLYYGITIIILFSLAYLGYWLRTLPMHNYDRVYELAIQNNIKEDIARYAYLTANDPWIEYWLAKYLHDHGITAWTALTRENNDTRIFWYPWGRDFTRTEYPLIPILGSLGNDPLFTTIMLPVYAGVAIIVVTFILLLFEYGLVAASLASLLLAVLPAATSRTFAGFVEKVGFSMPLLVFAVLTYMFALKKKDRRVAIISGAVGGLIVSAWGGYAVYGLLLAGTTLLVPLSVPREEKDYLKLTAYSSASYLIVGVILDKIGYGHVVLSYLLIPFIALAYTFIILLLIRGRIEVVSGVRKLLRVDSIGETRLYTYILLATIVVGVIIAPYIGIRGKYYATLLWPLKELGVIDIGRIGRTVAEMSSPLARPGGFKSLLADNGYIVGVLIPFASLYLLYLALRRKEIYTLPLALLALGSYYGVLGMAYLSQLSSVVGAIAVAVSTSLLFAKVLEKETKTTRKRRRIRQEGTQLRELYMLGSALMALLIVISGAIGLSRTMSSLSNEVATIAGFHKNFITFGWLYFLQYLNDIIPKNNVIVAWWDYGYWISVGSNHPTLADGGTLNGTQIALLAKMFTGTEEEANNILYKFGLRPGETYIVTHDIALYDAKNQILHYVYTLSTDDIRKAWAMHFIAGREEKYIDFVNALSSFDQQTLSQIVNNTFVFQMFADAPYHSDKIVTFLELGNVNITSVQISYGGVTPLALNKQEFRHFEPYMVVITPYRNLEGRILALQEGLYYVRVIIMYKWLG